MSLIPWRRKREDETAVNRPETSLAHFQDEMDSLFNRFLRDPWSLDRWASPLAELAAVPNTDLAETEDEISVAMELPGIDPKEIEIDITGNTLTVSGEKRYEREEKKKTYHRTERRFGSFQRSIQLPSSAEADNVKADYKAGVLRITVGKKPEAKPRRIEVRNA
jgi:HSP20 family protein